MDKRALQLKALAFIPIAFLSILIGGALVALGKFFIFYDLRNFSIPPFFGNIVYFSLKQALLSSFLSIALAIPVAWAFYINKNSWISYAFTRIFTLPIILSSLVVANAIILFYGTNGWFLSLLSNLGFNLNFSIYGLSGILVGHIFFNLPLAVRLFLISFESIPESYEKTAMQLNLTGFNYFKTLLWPYIWRQIPTISFFIFLLCLTSFTIVLILGGGPQSTTLEVEIFRNMTLGLDGFPSAIMLSLLQMLLTIILLLLLLLLKKPIDETTSSINQLSRVNKLSSGERYFSLFILGCAAIFIVLPLINLVISSLNYNLISLLSNKLVLKAIFTSAKIAFISSIFTMILSLFITMAQSPTIKTQKTSLLNHLLNNISYLIFIFSPIILSTGWFLLLYKYFPPASSAIYMIIILNIAISLPICGHILTPVWFSHLTRHDKLIKTFQVGFFSRLFLFDLPYLKTALSRCFAFAFIFSLGDLSIVSIWGGDGIITLPMLIQQNMSNYRTNDSATLSLILMLLSFIILLIFDRLNRKVS